MLRVYLDLSKVELVHVDVRGVRDDSWAHVREFYGPEWAVDGLTSENDGRKSELLSRGSQICRRAREILDVSKLLASELRSGRT